MIQRTILRQSAAAKAVLSRRSVSSAVRSSRTSPFPSLSQSYKPLPSRLAQRFYSSEAEASKEGEQKTEASATEELQKELEAKKKEIVDLKDKYLRSVADFRNLQERTKRDMEGARQFAIQRFAKDLIESIDNFDRALGAVPTDKLATEAAEANKDLQDLFSGLKMTENILMSTLAKHGLERFDPSELSEDGKTQKFDPNRHEATFMTKAEGKEDNDILHVQSKGFALNGRVLRAAKVGVVKNN